MTTWSAFRGGSSELRRRISPGTTLAIGLGVLAAPAFARLAEAVAPNLQTSLVAGVAGLLFLALTFVRFDVAVGIGLVLMAVVEFEPAPPDLAFAAIMLVAAISGRFDGLRAPRPVPALLAALALLNAISMVAVLDPVAALRFLLITVYLFAFALWLTGWLTSPRRARVLVHTWLWGAALSSLVAVVVVYVPVDFAARGHLVDPFTGDRANVLFEDANVFGPFLVPIFVILLEECLRPRLVRLPAALKGVLLLLLGLGVLVAFSRAGWINAVVAVTVTLAGVALRSGGLKKVALVTGGFTASAAAALYVLSSIGGLTFLQQRAQLQAYDDDRFAAQRAGLEMALQYPSGVGPGQFGSHYDYETHSTYVRVLSEQGIAGFVALIALLAVTLWLAVRNFLTSADTLGVGSAALLGSWCGLLVNSLVVDTLHWRHLWVVAGLIWAGAVATAGRREAPGRQASDMPA